MLIFVIAVPVLAVMLGGLYSLPAIKLTRGREPWLSILLGLGLAITIAALGLPAGLSWPVLAILWVVCLLLMMAARWFYGSLGESLESFGIVHMVALMAVFAAGSWKHHASTPPAHPAPAALNR